jgi:hypothetical protein
MTRGLALLRQARLVWNLGLEIEVRERNLTLNTDTAIRGD